MDSLANDLKEKAAIGVSETTNRVTDSGPSITIDAVKMPSRRIWKLWLMQNEFFRSAERLIPCSCFLACLGNSNKEDEDDGDEDDRDEDEKTDSTGGKQTWIRSKLLTRPLKLFFF